MTYFIAAAINVFSVALISYLILNHDWSLWSYILCWLCWLDVEEYEEEEES